MALTTTIAASIQVQDVVTNNLVINKVLVALSFLGSVSTVAEAITVGTTPTSLALPISPAQVVYIRNTHATQTLAVSWTPNGGASNPVITLQPSAYILFGEPNTTSGITAVSVTGSASGTTLEYIFVG